VEFTKSLIELLDLEELDTDLYRGINEHGADQWPALFGGQVAAQALMAAARTAPEDRVPHSLHGYFLRPGRADRPVILRVARDRDGRSFSARHVVAVQNGEVIFSMSASFHTAEESTEYSMERAAPAVGPDDLPTRSQFGRFDHSLDIKSLPFIVPLEEGEFAAPSRMWVRTREALPDDPMLHACALVYASDLGSGFGDGTAPGVRRGGPSVDHSLWFQNPIRMDGWVMLEMWPLKAGGSRGLYHGWMHDEAGTMGAMLAQEILFRTPKGPFPFPLPPPAPS
jgi:acyl-CoA thioesterase-2